MKEKEPKILVVEDDSLVAMDIKQSLRFLGYRVVSPVSTGEAALESVEKNHPNLVMMDVKLAGQMDGISAAEKIHAYYDIPVIYLSAYSDSKTLRRAKDTNPFGYIVKPFNKNDLNTAIQIALQKHQQELKLKEGLEWFSSIFQSFCQPVLIADKKGVIRFVNPCFTDMTGLQREKIQGRPLKELIKIHDEKGHEIKINIFKILKSDNFSEIGWVEITGKDNREVQAHLSVGPLRDSRGKDLGVTFLFRQSDDGAMSHKEKEQMLENLIDTIESAVIKRRALDICPWCKRVSEGNLGIWNQLEYYIRQDEAVEFSHLTCPRCLKWLGLGIAKHQEKKKSKQGGGRRSVG